MAFDGNEGCTISLSQAAEWTENYRDEAGSGATKAHFFGRNTIQDILDQSDCEGIRIYYGIDGDGAKQLILVGAKANEDDITSGLVIDCSKPCPPHCGRANDLNS